MNWFVTALKNYAVFSGRSRRSEYWYFGLFYLIFYVAAAVVDVMIGSFERTSGIGRRLYRHPGPGAADPVDLRDRPPAARHRAERLVGPHRVHSPGGRDHPAGVPVPG
jgi:hypothetical protein